MGETTKKKIIAVLPARFQSSRFPGKPLAPILGKPMIQWVYERVSNAIELEDVYVATDDERIFNCVKSFGGKVLMTEECNCGTDRVYQAVKDLSCDIIINVQGDEPTIDYREVSELIRAFDDNAVYMATLKKKIDSCDEIDDPNIVKVITDANNDALYFSRSRLPFDGRSDEKVPYFRHVGIYGYTKEFLKKYVSLQTSEHEKIEKLEQLRVLDNGYKIRVVETEFENIGVDTVADIKKAEKALRTILEQEL